MVPIEQCLKITYFNCSKVMRSIENFIIGQSGEVPIVTDLYLDDVEEKKPVIIYCHGYKGFKDWGHLPLMAPAVIREGYQWLKFNFSHGGTTLDNPSEFADLELFGNNNYSLELADIQRVINWIFADDNEYAAFLDTQRIYLLGHSRGGAMAILTAAFDRRVKKLVTWSAVSDLGRRFPNSTHLKKWAERGVWFVENSRTKQRMPHYYQFYEDFIQNRQRLNVIEAEKNLKIPHLIIHGTDDETVYLGEALHLMSSNDHASLIKLHGATHTFGAFHPYNSSELPHQVEKALDYSLTFFRTNDQPPI
jgi:pimeloyl-ACP methyl ester carboxylesterase